MDHIARTLNAKPRALTHEFPVNYALYKNGRLITLVEVKCRRTAMWQFPTLIMSTRKLDRAYELAERSGVPLMVVTKWADNLGYLRVRDPYRYPVKTGGRTDRGDEQDIEALYDIPIGKFKLFPERAHG
tara:strand:+ start:11080 stop:11466 length:387 start_codon:yes stop_codon:yes gene_type:complete